MGVVDIVLLALVLVFTLAGLRYGFVQAAGSLVGLVAGILIGGIGTTWLGNTFAFMQTGWTRAIVFFVIVLVIANLVSWLFEFLDDLLHIFSIIPFLKTANSLLGAVLGFLEGVTVVFAIAFLAELYLPEGFLRFAILESGIISHLSWAMNLIQMVFPFLVAVQIS